MVGLYLEKIGRLRQLSEPRLRQQAGIEKSQTPVERDILVQWVRINIISCLNEGAVVERLERRKSPETIMSLNPGFIIRRLENFCLSSSKWVPFSNQ